MKRSITFRLSDDEHKALLELAEYYGLTLSKYLRFLIHCDLHDLDPDDEKLFLAAKRESQ
ncbi:MAG: hypothetical protein HKO64_02660 [Xanthomonadales bacterium]|nr:hypothetical protein [Xanthomonadales bacterium]